MAGAAALMMPNSDYVEQAREKLIVALDFWDIDDARKLVDDLGDDVSFYKVGLGLQLAGGDEFAKELKQRGKRVFLDYKWQDIEETMKTAVKRAADLNIDFVTVHAAGGTLKAAVEGRGTSKLKILCVTVLTSMDAEDIKEMGFQCNVEELVLARATKALNAGCDGVIASAREATAIRKQTNNKLMIVSPGIRAKGSVADDQKRTSTPYEAIQAGADYLVIGRPITAARDPKNAANTIVAEMANALKSRSDVS
jgi:orotidine-5'-phosphate decarboxylase